MPKLVADNSGFGEWRRRLVLNGRKKPIDCRENVYWILAHHPVWAGRLAFDEFAQRVVLRTAPEIEGFAPGEWREQDDLRLGWWFAQVEHLPIRSERTLARGVYMAAIENTFHPVRDFLNGLEWDRVPRVDHWMADCLGVAPGDYAARVGRYFLLNMIARVMTPGCIMRSVPVLEGAQDRGKSTALRMLAAPWFSDTHLDLGSKDIYQQISAVWLYEISEMHGFSKSEVSRVKEFVSSREDNFRPPYATGPVKLSRQVVFAGTINASSHYLRDWSGNTRFWPIRCEVSQPIDIERLENMRSQLFAEAMTMHAAGERRYPDPEEFARLFLPEQEMREAQHEWTAVIASWLEDTTSDRVYPIDILRDCLKFEVSKIQEQHSPVVGRIMERLGWIHRREGTGKRRYFYERPPVAKKPALPPEDVPY